MIILLKAIINQNYFQLEEEFYKPKTGIEMVSTISSILAETLLQNLEQVIKHTIEN
jgi:hypothetical protein